MKKIAIFMAVCLLAAALSVPALAVDNYTFGGAAQANFGGPTSTDDYTADVPDPAAITDKDAAFAPPTFGSPSAYMPWTGERLTPNLVNGGAGPDYGDTVYPGDVVVPPSVSGIVFPPSANINTPLPTIPALTPPKYNADGSIGQLSIPKLNVSIRVYEGESLANFKKGSGHFTFTSAWNGNVCLAAHNRGTNAYFGQIHTLKNGDRITYTTPYGTRTYTVFFVGQVKETDFSRLTQTSDNIITLITCVRDVPAMRVCVQARQI